MFKPKISEEERLKREAERRAAFGRARLARINDSANWNRGFHVNEIEAQKLERLDRQKAEKNEDIEYSKYTLTLAEDSLAQEKKRSAEKRARLHEAAQNLLAVDKMQSDTFDLNDPEILRKTGPPRVGDDAPVHVSSLQKFDGEDLAFSTRQSLQQKEMRTRLMKQMQEHENQRKEEKMSDREYAEVIKKQTALLEKMELMKNERRHTKNVNVAKENSRILAEQAKHVEEKRKAEALLVEKDVATTKSSALLTEKLEDTVRVDNSNRYIPYGFKGFGMEKTVEFFNERIQQAQEHENLKKKMRAQEMEWAAKEEAQRREMLTIEMERRRDRLVKREQYAKELQRQAMQHKDILLKTKQEFTNEVTEDFFSQFGTSHR